MISKTLTALSISICLLSTSYAKEIYKDENTVVKSRGWLTMAFHDSESSNEITDSGSRIGLSFLTKVQNDWRVGATFEWATNFNKNDNLVLNRGGDSNGPAGDSADSFSTRHGYAQLVHDKWGSFTIGKQWAAYYDVTWATDILNFWGGNAGGSFNLGSDGGLSGTGRVEQAIIWRKSYNDFEIALQYQAQDEAIKINSADESIDGMELGSTGNGYGVTGAYNYDKFRFAAGINVVDIDIKDQFKESISGDTEDRAIAASITYSNNISPGFYGSFVYVTSESHEVDNEGTYYDADGMELLLWYNFDNLIGIYGGFNNLTPDDSSNDYEYHYNFAGIQYQFENSMGVLFIESKFDDITLVDGSEEKNTDVALGVRIFL